MSSFRSCSRQCPVRYGAGFVALRSAGHGAADRGVMDHVLTMSKGGALEPVVQSPVT